jgi:Holliday junction resolvasome RuvABC endonuclease subunit
MEYGIDCSLNNVGLSKWNNGVLQELHLLRNDKVKYPKKVLKSEIIANKIHSIFNFIDENVMLCSDVVYIERPSGSQDSNGMVNYAIEICVYSYLKNKGLNVQWVKVNDVKKVLTGKKDATKKEMIEKAHHMYPHALQPEYDWLTDKNGKLYNYNEHLADSIAVYLAGKTIDSH